MYNEFKVGERVSYNYFGRIKRGGVRSISIFNDAVYLKIDAFENVDQKQCGRNRRDLKKRLLSFENIRHNEEVEKINNLE